MKLAKIHLAVRRMEERLEAYDRASRQNSIVIKGLPLPVMGLKSYFCQFLREKFNYVGQVSNGGLLAETQKIMKKPIFLPSHLSLSRIK